MHSLEEFVEKPHEPTDEEVGDICIQLPFIS